jgi:hypothetical protein
MRRQVLVKPTTVNLPDSPSTQSFFSSANCHSAHSPNKLYELRIHKKKSAQLPRPDKFKGTVLRKNLTGYYTLA